MVHEVWWMDEHDLIKNEFSNENENWWMNVVKIDGMDFHE
jgi:hypothetical protein